jgi:threonine dehydrogenase-like Zn-dependent dehydrogenase
MARPKHDSSDRLWTEKDDLKTLFNLIRGGRLNFKDMISEIHSPAKAQEVFTRLATEKNFPIGVLFDWNLI